ncbi:lipoyl(octanoyl) transferase LipB [Parasphingopyxis lamellibrachiae]|uniref:Octanoyltransferase n=1 Tax=Parasphingopyxis lamellibrachiae TaxID=680125 RepID=A0A3D9FDV9_9SPHN|nr:lipoyl(octanoyl) transferase LipB [Parasphingopyxis lamellibrachiae]RED15236.1 lipoyl(octanoyl) transferase [Parasphingopyxis lamellibrachiae]
METNDIEWRTWPGLTDYPGTLANMEERAAAIHRGEARECVWLLEHPPLYTAGTSAAPEELISAERFPVYTAGRGGRYTYHGPGQRVVYVMLDLSKRGRDVRHFVHSLEAWVIASLAELGVEARRAEGRIGIWADDGDSEAKIGAIGVRIRRWVSFHGFALNVAPDLAHFDGIIPCGIAEYPVTSLAKLGLETSMEAVDAAIHVQFPAFLELLETPETKD